MHAFDADTGEELWVTRVGVHQNDDLKEVPPGEAVVVYPGSLGGVETFMAYADGVVYVPVVNLPTTYTASSKRITSLEGTGDMIAIDVDTGSILWDTEFDEIVVGSATVVNDLVITSVFGGTIYALDRATGQIVWSFEASAGVNAPPAIVGDTIIVPAGMPSAPKHIPSLMALSLGK